MKTLPFASLDPHMAGPVLWAPASLWPWPAGAWLGRRRRRRRHPPRRATHAAHHSEWATTWAWSARSRRTASTRNAYLRAFNFSDLPDAERARYYRETPRPRRLAAARVRDLRGRPRDRDRARRLLPGLDLQRPGARADDSRHRGRPDPHPLPQPGLASAHACTSTAGTRRRWTARCPSIRSQPGGEFVYEFDADPFGLHLYHCHAVPLEAPHPQGALRRLHRRSAGRRAPPADEMVMMMNGFDTNFDADNEVYAVNTVAHFHMAEPIRVEVGKLVRIYLVNVTEFDPDQQLPPARHVLHGQPHRHAAAGHRSRPTT